MEGVAAVNEEVFGQTLYIIASGGLSCGVIHANPGQRIGLLLPEILVFIESYLINLEPLTVVFVVEVAQAQDTGSRLVHAEQVEVKQHHLAIELGQGADASGSIG